MTDNKEVKPKDYLDTDPKIRIKQLEAIQEFLLLEGRNDEDINSAILEMREWLL